MIRLASLLSVLVLVAFAGCGSDDDAPAGGGERLSRAAFVRQANAICERNRDAIGQEVARLTQDPEIQELEGPAQQAEVLERIVPATRDRFAQLRRLRAPAELETGFRDFTTQVDEAFALTSDLAGAIRSGDEDALRELTTRFTEIAGPTRRFAQETGIIACLPDTAGSGAG